MKLEKLIREKKFDEAIDYLSQADHSAEAIKNYNKAFLQFKKQDLVSARYFLEKAQKLGLFSREVDDAFEVVKSELGLKTIENSYYKEDLFVFKTIGFHSDVYMSTMGIFLLIGLVAFGKAKYFIGLVAMIFLVGTSSYFYIIKDHKLKINQKEAIVHSGPSKIFEGKQLLLPGMKVITTKESKDWTFIKYPEAFRGWVYKHEAIEI